MNRHALARRLRLILIGIALCGLLFYSLLLPCFLHRGFADSPMAFWAHLLLLWISGIPCYIVLWFGLRVVRNIAADRSFCKENAAHLGAISTLASIDTVYIFLCDILLLVLGVGEGLMLLLSVVIMFVGVAVSVTAAALSHLILRAAELQEQSDLTI